MLAEICGVSVLLFAALSATREREALYAPPHIYVNVTVPAAMCRDAAPNRSGAVYSAARRQSEGLKCAGRTEPPAGLPRAIGTPLKHGELTAESVDSRRKSPPSPDGPQDNDRDRIARCNSRRVRPARFVPDVLVALASSMRRADLSALRRALGSRTWLSPPTSAKSGGWFSALFVGYEESRRCLTMIYGRCAQIPAVRRRLGERVKSTRCCRPRTAQYGRRTRESGRWRKVTHAPLVLGRGLPSRHGCRQDH